MLPVHEMSNGEMENLGEPGEVGRVCEEHKQGVLEI